MRKNPFQAEEVLAENYRRSHSSLARCSGRNTVAPWRKPGDKCASFWPKPALAGRKNLAIPPPKLSNYRFQEGQTGTTPYAPPRLDPVAQLTRPRAANSPNPPASEIFHLTYSHIGMYCFDHGTSRNHLRSLQRRRRAAPPPDSHLPGRGRARRGRNRGGRRASISPRFRSTSACCAGWAWSACAATAAIASTAPTPRRSSPCTSGPKPSSASGVTNWNA